MKNNTITAVLPGNPNWLEADPINLRDPISNFQCNVTEISLNGDCW